MPRCWIFFPWKGCALQSKEVVYLFFSPHCCSYQKKMECFFFFFFFPEELLRLMEAENFKLFWRKSKFSLNSKIVFFPQCSKTTTISQNKACRKFYLTPNNKLYVLGIHLFLSANDLFNYSLAKEASVFIILATPVKCAFETPQ